MALLRKDTKSNVRHLNYRKGFLVLSYHVAYGNLRKKQIEVAALL